MKQIKGRVWKFGDNINTDNMSPARYMFSIEEVAKHCLEAVRPEFCKNIKRGDIVLGGDNFGTGSSREMAPAALKELGVALIIAKSFARIFYRNSINIGLPVIISPESYSAIDDGDMVSANLSNGKITNESKSLSFHTESIPQMMMDILESGGLIKYAIEKKW